MKSAVIFILLISVSACFIRKSVTNTDYEGQKILMVNNVSLFGGLKFDSSNLSNNEGTISLVYKKDSLCKIISGNDKKYQFYYNVVINEKNISLTSESKYPRYVIVDTIIFFAGQCYWKKMYYEYNLINLNQQWAGKTTFFHYTYKDNALLRKDDNYFREDSDMALIPISNYVNIKSQTAPAKITDYHTLESGLSQEYSELLFFRKYIMRK